MGHSSLDCLYLHLPQFWEFRNYPHLSSTPRNWNAPPERELLKVLFQEDSLDIVRNKKGIISVLYKESHNRESSSGGKSPCKGYLASTLANVVPPFYPWHPWQHPSVGARLHKLMQLADFCKGRCEGSENMSPCWPYCLPCLKQKAKEGSYNRLLGHLQCWILRPLLTPLELETQKFGSSDQLPQACYGILTLKTETIAPKGSSRPEMCCWIRESLLSSGFHPSEKILQSHSEPQMLLVRVNVSRQPVGRLEFEFHIVFFF